MGKRYISIGFKRPKRLERDIIYVTLEKETGGIRAHAISTEEFNYTIRAIAGNPLGETTKEITNHEGMEGHFRDYKRFIKEIIEKNDGIKEDDRLVEEGSEPYRVMRELLR